MVHGNNTKIVKEANKYNILSAIRIKKVVTVKDLMSITGLSRPTVCSVLDELLKAEIIKADGYVKAEVGRAPIMYRLDERASYCVGVDLELPMVRLAFSNMGDEVVYYKEWSVNDKSSPDTLLEDILHEIKAGTEQLRINRDDIVGICMGIPGLVDSKNNIIIHAPRMSDLDGSGIANSLQKCSGIHTYIRNDVQLMAMVDTVAVSNMPNDFLYIGYRTGIGMSIYMNKKVLTGHSGNAGYIGHTTISVNGRRCSCGNRGCLEMYCSRTAIKNRYNESMDVNKKKEHFNEILEAADAGDELAKEVLAEGALYLGNAIANSMKLFDIDTVIIGDMPDNKYYLTCISNVIIQALVGYFDSDSIKVVLGDNNFNNCVKGACQLVKADYFKEPKLRLS